MIFVTGGAGFIGSNFVLDWFAQSQEPVINLDNLTYAANPANLSGLSDNPSYRFVHGDICDRELLRRLLETHAPRAVVHFAAESHVDRSIHGPDAFIQSNVVGTFSLLEECRAYWMKRASKATDAFRFLQVSTDEVYGSLGPQDAAFNESTAYAPNSPYSASKASGDHLVRAYHHTYGLPTLTTNCSNNYGPYQFPEKLIPLMIVNALQAKPLPIYGDGLNVRDWLYVGDHCAAIRAVLDRGRIGEVYNIGGDAELGNLDVVKKICAILDELKPRNAGSYQALIEFVADRPGHDRRYAIDARKIRSELAWAPIESFDSGLRRTVQWYLDHPRWTEAISSGEYKNWLATNYQQRAAQHLGRA